MSNLTKFKHILLKLQKSIYFKSKKKLTEIISPSSPTSAVIVMMVDVIVRTVMIAIYRKIVTRNILVNFDNIV
jgi:hypothetical protein